MIIVFILFFIGYKMIFNNQKCSSKMCVYLYVITYNSPRQFSTLVQSMLTYDSNFIDKPYKRILLNNSSDISTTSEYQQLCQQYNFEHIKKDNLGITGGRKFIADHFEKEKEGDCYFFFEDDMFFYPPHMDTKCKNDTDRYYQDLYNTCLGLINYSQLDYLKLNYTEVFSSHKYNFAWRVMSNTDRDKYFPHHHLKHDDENNSDNWPVTTWKNKYYNNLKYLVGDTYYSNWPQLITRRGNRILFTEYTSNHNISESDVACRSYILSIMGTLKMGVLLLTPTEHDRIDQYDLNTRKEY